MMIEIDDDEILPLSLKHNFWTWSAQGKVNPIPIKLAEGFQVLDQALGITDRSVEKH